MVPMLQTLPGQMMRDANTCEATAKTIWAFYRMPKLIYIPYKWGNRDKAQWRAMSHARKCCGCLRHMFDADSMKDRLQALNARAGALMYKDVVMPMDLAFDAIERVSYPAFDKPHV